MYLLNEVIKATEEGDGIRLGLTIIVYVQYLDRTVYDSVNFDDPISTLSYFKKIQQSYTRTSDEEVDNDFEAMLYFFKLRSERGSKLSAEAQAHQIMRSTAEKIHATFRDLEQEGDGGTRAVFVTSMVLEAQISLLKLMRDCVVEEYKHLQTLSS